jgi:hypothetical protein
MFANMLAMPTQPVRRTSGSWQSLKRGNFQNLGHQAMVMFWYLMSTCQTAGKPSNALNVAHLVVKGDWSVVEKDMPRITAGETRAALEHW